MKNSWLEFFPALEKVEENMRPALMAATQIVDLPAGAVPFRHGGTCDNYLFVISGRVRVQMGSETGREIVLYRVEGGQTCILTTACLMARDDYPAEAVAETAVTAAVLPSKQFHELLSRSGGFRAFVFEAYGQRLLDLMLLIQEVAFQRIDIRLAEFLLDNIPANRRLDITHQNLAVELGSVREVISRQLKEFERRSWVSLHRGSVDVINPEALRDLTRKARW
ncbi:MAG: Crp/Fnr family transcriptional regulator [Rhodospirillales bacterium]|nr:Crp/Fnr family transcriptional regulator [Rhodospirillales bacterium]